MNRPASYSHPAILTHNGLCSLVEQPILNPRTGNSSRWVAFRDACIE